MANGRARGSGSAPGCEVVQDTTPPAICAFGVSTLGGGFDTDKPFISVLVSPGTDISLSGGSGAAGSTQETLRIFDGIVAALRRS